MTSRSVLFFLSVLLAGSSLAEERAITLVGDKWCPFNCDDQPDHRGVLVERAASALAEEGFSLEYFEMPWSRAIISVRDGQFDAIVGTGRSETPDFYFPPEPLAYARHSFFTLPSVNWRYSGVKSLARIRLGVIQDYSYGGLYEDYIEGSQSDESRIITLRGNQVLPRLVDMLRLGRIDALVAEESVLNYHFALRGKENPLRYAGLANEEALYVAFSPALDNGAELAESLERGMKKVGKLP